MHTHIPHLTPGWAHVQVWGILAASATGMKSLLKQQREVRISIFNGKGIAAHMEDSYVAGLGGVIAAEVAGLVAKSRKAKEPEAEKIAAAQRRLQPRS